MVIKSLDNSKKVEILSLKDVLALLPKATTTRPRLDLFFSLVAFARPASTARTSRPMEAPIPRMNRGDRMTLRSSGSGGLCSTDFSFWGRPLGET